MLEFGFAHPQRSHLQKYDLDRRYRNLEYHRSHRNLPRNTEAKIYLQLILMHCAEYFDLLCRKNQMN